MSQLRELFNLFVTDIDVIDSNLPAFISLQFYFLSEIIRHQSQHHIDNIHIYLVHRNMDKHTSTPLKRYRIYRMAEDPPWSHQPYLKISSLSLIILLITIWMWLKTASLILRLILDTNL